MKKLRALALATLAALTTPCFSAGPYDGIYHLGGSSWYSVHQNGNQLIVGGFWQIPATGIDIYLPDGQIVRSIPRMDSWDLMGGIISGNAVTVSGEVNFGACNATYSVVFDSTGATVTRHAMTNTALANSRGVSCSALRAALDYYTGTSFRVVRIF